jgi:hypothetical protein
MKRNGPYCPVPRLPPVSGLAPEIYGKFSEFLARLRDGKLELRTKEVARQRIARLNQCHL